MSDLFELERFIAAQQSVFAGVQQELRSGRKKSHWMWFIFPQIQGLGQSYISQKYSISSLRQATAYLDHPVLGPRLRECTRLINQVDGKSIEEIFGYPDFLKFRSSMTLFARASADNRVFIEALAKYFSGQEDPSTLSLL